MLATALEAEVNAYIAELVDQRDENGRRLVVRNGYHQPRKTPPAITRAPTTAPTTAGQRHAQTIAQPSAQHLRSRTSSTASNCAARSPDTE